MAKTKIIQTNFTGGELSPSMLGRVDTVKYQNGAAKLQNMLVRPQGGLWKRTGSYFVGAVKTQTKKTIVKEFEYSNIQAYILELGDLYFRIWYDGGFVETSPGSGVPLTITTTYLESELADLTFTQSADVLYVFHPSHVTAKIRRLGANSWDIIDCDFQDGPYLTNNPANTPTNFLKVSEFTSVAKAVSTIAMFVQNTSSKIINAINRQATYWEFTTSTNHGYATGNYLALSGLAYRPHNTIASTRVSITGSYYITVTAVNKFYCTTAWFNTLDSSAVDQWYFSGALVAPLNTVKFFEYRQGNIWQLAQVLTITNTTHADVLVFQNVKTGIPRSSVQAIDPAASNYLNSSLAGVFTLDDIGQYIRASDGSWYQILGYKNDSSVKVGATAGTKYNIPLISYDRATMGLTVSPTVMNATVTSLEDTFVATDVGRSIRFNFGGKRPWGKIVGYFTTKSVKITLYVPVPLDPTNVTVLYADGIADAWLLGAWSITTGYPKVGVFHEQRLWTGGTTVEPLNLWASQPNDYENMASTEYDSIVLDSSAINYTLVANEANPILWMNSGAILLVGTLGGEWQVKAASSINQPITPTNINITPQTNNGSLKGCKPIMVGNSLLFVQRAGRKLIELIYDFQQDSYIGRNLNVVSDHILRKGGKAKVIAYQNEPNNIIWIVLSDGSLAAMTYERDQQVMAWHPHDLGGGGLVESIASVESNAGTESLIYMVVKRVLSGVTKRYIEYFTPDFYPATDLDRSPYYFVDCGLTITGASLTTITGLGHLTGETVSVVSDGKYKGEFTISGTTLAVSGLPSTVHIGYKYTGYVKVLPLEGGSREGGTTQGKTKRIAKTMARVYNTTDFKYGTSLQKLDIYKVVNANGTPVDNLLTGDPIINVPMGYTLDAMYYLVQDAPMPFVVLAIAPDVEVTT